VTVAEFFDPLLTVASWIVGLVGGFVFGLVVVAAIVGVGVVVVFALVWAFCAVADKISMWRHRRALRRIREKTERIRADQIHG
jgi:glycerol-3-phosphate acyltransferase PlsY